MRRTAVVDESMNVLKWIFNGLLALGAWVLTYTGLPAEPVAILTVLMCVDFVAGISKSRVTGIPVTSYRIKVGAISKCGVMTVPLVMALTAKGLGADFNWLVNWTVSVFILSEAYSIIANVYTIKTGKIAPEWDAISLILRKIRSAVDLLDKR